MNVSVKKIYLRKVEKLMKSKKLISTLLSAAILASFAPMAMAETSTESVWNYALVESGTEELYEAFPFVVDSIRRNNMGMDLYFQYLKNITADSTVNVKVTDISDDSVVIDKELSSGDVTVYLSEIPNEKIYLVEVTENLNGQAETYTKYIETKFTSADFPVNMTLGDTVINKNYGEDFAHIMYRKIEDEQEETTNGTEVTEEIEGVEETVVPSKTTIVEAAELNSFYDDLDANSYYELQMETDNERYYGYISTYPDGDNMGIVTRGYEMRDTLATAGAYALNGARETDEYWLNLFDFYKEKAVDYQSLKNDYIDFTQCNYTKVYKFVYPETGDYTFETIGNADTKLILYHEINGTPSQSVGVDDNGGTGNNGQYTYGMVVEEEHNPVAYIVVKCQDTTETNAAFRIIYDDYETIDDHTNYFDEIRSQTALGNYSDAINDNEYLDYSGDVDFFAYDISSGYGYARLLKKGDKYAEKVIVANVYEEGEDPNHDYDSYWWYESLTSEGTVEPEVIDYNTGTYYFEVLLRKKDLILPSTDEDGDDISDYYDGFNYNYSFEFYDPKYKDALDLAGTTSHGNNVPIYATEIPFNQTSEWDNLTLHKSDSDYFKFTTGAYGGNIAVTVDCSDMPASYNFAYTPHLYDGEVIQCTVNENGTITTSNIEDMADYTTTGRKNVLTYNNLEPNHVYYVRTSRPSSTQYSSYYPYSLKIEFEAPDVPSAVLENNVSLTHTVGDNITSTSAFLTTVMQNLTCKINGEEVADATAQADVQLYYNDSILTADMVNLMSAGTYNITAKYQNIEATGGTITLTVSETTVTPEDNIVELSSVTKERASANNDWAAVAKMMANVRLAREGKTQYSSNAASIATAVMGMSGTRGTLAQTIRAANYVYEQATGMTTECTDFQQISLDANYLKDDISFYIECESAIILQMVSSTAPTDMTQARYLLVSGINLTTNEVKVIDPAISAAYVWVPLSTLINGGYNNNSNLVFSGTIIEGII